jgi:hypothetical protein
MGKSKIGTWGWLDEWLVEWQTQRMLHVSQTKRKKTAPLPPPSPPQKKLDVFINTDILRNIKTIFLKK